MCVAETTTAPPLDGSTNDLEIPYDSTHKAFGSVVLDVPGNVAVAVAVADALPPRSCFCGDDVSSVPVLQLSYRSCAVEGEKERKKE